MRGFRLRFIARLLEGEKMAVDWRDRNGALAGSNGRPPLAVLTGAYMLKFDPLGEADFS